MNIPAKVVSIERREAIARAWKDEQGNAHTEYTDLGWFMTIQINRYVISIGTRDEKPDYQTGDEIIIAIRKREK